MYISLLKFNLSIITNCDSLFIKLRNIPITKYTLIINDIIR